MITPQKETKTPNIKRISLSNWLKGYESAYDDDRKDQAGLKITSNVIMDQNGTIRPRPSMVPYGTQPQGTILGSVSPFIKMDSSSPPKPLNYEICVMNVAGVAQAYVRKDGAAWTLCTGKTYNLTAKCHFEQINQAVLISNGVDTLSYLDIPTLNVIPFTALVTPVISSVVQTGIAGTNYTYRYRVSAVGNGETAASTASTVSVGVTRNQWTGGTSEFVTITWSRITGATRYNIYLGTQAGFEYYLDTVADPGSGSMTYVDNSSVVLNVNRVAPEGDSTAGPTVTRCADVMGQIFMVGDTANPYRVWFGGTGSGALDFSAFDGGGWVEVDKGGRQFPVVVKGFRDGHGNPVATCVMKGTSGKGKLVHISMTSTSLGSTLITYAALAEANGQDGTSAPDGVIYHMDSLWYPSRDGFKSTGTKAQMQNILSTNNFSAQILPDVLNLNNSQMDACVGMEYSGRLYWAIPLASSTNNQVWISDLNRGGIWSNPWYVNVDWMWLYDDNTGLTHHMALSGNKIYEFSYSQLTKDGTTAFGVEIGSGLIKFSPDGMEWGSVVDITFVLERPQGVINFNVTGFTEDLPLTSVGAAQFVGNTSVVGWNEFTWNDTNYGWDAVVNIPTIFGSARQEVVIQIGDQLKWLTWDVSSNTPGVDFQLADVIIRYVDVGVLTQT